MSELNQSQLVAARTADSNWRLLYKIGGWAALLVPIIYLGALVVNIFGYRAAPFPETIVEWFTVFQANWLVGLIFLGLITSYFREPTTFPMALDVPEGKQLGEVKELLSDEIVPFTCDGATARIHVELGFDTPAKLFLFALKWRSP